MEFFSTLILSSIFFLRIEQKLKYLYIFLCFGHTTWPVGSSMIPRCERFLMEITVRWHTSAPVMFRVATNRDHHDDDLYRRDDDLIVVGAAVSMQQ